MALGNDTFGADWQQARHWLIERYTTKHTPENIRRSAKDLTPDELTAIRADMAKWNGRLVEMWQARRAELDAITVGDAVEDAAGIPA
jgi:phage gp16-like protein